MPSRVDVCVRWLTDLLETAEPGTRLPSQRELAKRFGVSSKTIGRALRQPLHEGRLYGGPGVGLRVGPAPDQPQVPLASPVRSLTERLLQAIAEGAWQHGQALPPQRELCRRFAVGWPSLVQALEELERRGVLHRQGRQWLLGRGGSTQSTGNVAVVALFADDMHLGKRQVRQLLGPMEDALHRLGLRLSIQPPDRFAAVCDTAVLASERIRGLVHVHQGDSPQAVLDRWRSFVTRYPRAQVRLLLLGKRLPEGRPPPERADLLTFDSLATLAARTAVDLAVRRPPREVVILHDGRRPRQLKRSLRVVVELGLRLPHCRWRVVIVRPDLPAKDGAFLDALLALDDVDEASYSRLLAEHGRLDLAGLRRGITTCEDPASLQLHAEDLVLLSTPELVDALCRDGCCPALAERAGSRCVCLHDGSACRRHGIAASDADWPGTAQAVVHALLGDLPVARGSHGYLRPRTRFLPRAFFTG